ATRRIRTGGRTSLPIVAMTANAFGENRRACLDAGMNDHVSKPVDPERLYATLARWLPVAADGAPLSEPAPRPRRTWAPVPLQGGLAEVEGLDVRRALRCVADQPALLRRVLEAFVAKYRHATRSMDARQAHSLRGACASIGAVRLEAKLRAYERALHE